MKVIIESQTQLCAGGSEPTGWVPDWLLQHWYSSTQPFAPATSTASGTRTGNMNNETY